MCVPSLRFAYCTAVESHSFDRISRDFNFEVPGYCVLKNLGGLLVWVLWQHIPAVLDPEGRGGRFVAWFWAWFWNCLLTPWTFDSSGHIIGATCLPSTARSDNSFDKFVLSIVLSSLADLDRYGTGIWCPVQGPCGSRQRNCVSVDGDGVLG